MKRLFLSIFILLIGSNAWAFDSDYVDSSLIYTADQSAIVSGGGYFFGILVVTDGTNPVVFKIYDSLTATGTKVVPDLTITTGASDRVQRLDFDPPIVLGTGLSVDITIGGGSVSYVIYYREKL